ncbi:type III polyketide synthase [Allosphingosinicella flava]|nr:type III polyketide synthase [Sphingosinicella flava]
MHVALLSVASAVPPHILIQDEAKALARRLFGHRLPHFERLAPIFGNAGIAKRHVAQPLDWYERPQGWEARNAAYVEAGEALYVEAASAALAKAGLHADEVDTLVTVSTTGVATPSLEARVSSRMGFRADAKRVPIFGLGCAGGVTGLATAARLARAQPGETVLFVTVELCSLSMRLDVLSKANIVATALFADGAAACVLRCGEGGGLARIGEGSEFLWPDTLGIMGWSVDDTGLGVIFDRAIPPFVAANLAGGIDTLCRNIGIARGDIGRFICHPGGAKVIAALEESLGLGTGTLDHERAVLHNYGNMSAPTVLFVLERALAMDLPERALLLSLGPGFTASALEIGRP